MKYFLRNKRKNGITLIALVITVIVLLILISVVLNVIMGSNGLIAKARWSAYVTEYEQVNEAKELYATQKIMEKYTSSKKVEKMYKVADIVNTQNTTDTIYPVSDKITDISESLKYTIMRLENIFEDDIDDINFVNLYKVDFSKISVQAQREYVINIVNGRLYSIQSEAYQDQIYHTPKLGIGLTGEGKIILETEEILEPGVFELIVDAGEGQIANWKKLKAYYGKYVENSLSCNVYTSDDKIEWTSETVQMKEYISNPQEIDIINAHNTRYLKIEINIESINGENSELNYILINYYKYKDTGIKPIIDATNVELVGNLYTQGTVTQTLTTPPGNENYILNFDTVYGNPSTTLKINGTEQVYTINNVSDIKNINIPSNSTVEVTTTLSEGEGISEVKLLVQDNTVTKQQKDKNDIIEENEEDEEEWRTVTEKTYFYINEEKGFWEKCLFNSKEVASDGILEQSSNKQVKFTYQTSNDGEEWSEEFSNVQNAEDIKYLRVIVKYQVKGNIEYGNTSSNIITVLLNDGYWTATFKDENGNIISTQRFYFTRTNQSDISMPEAEEKEGKVFLGWNDGNNLLQPNTVYTLTEDIEFIAYYVDWYTITYNANGGTGSTESQTKEYNVAINLRTNGFTAPEGKEFKEWNTKADGTGTKYVAGASYTANANLTLYAIWRTTIDISLNKTALTINKSDSEQLTVTVVPNNISRTVVWSSDNENIATVDTNGNVTGVSCGTTTINVKVTTLEGCERNAQCNIKVLAVWEKYSVINVYSYRKVSSATARWDKCDNYVIMNSDIDSEFDPETGLWTATSSSRNYSAYSNSELVGAITFPNGSGMSSNTVWLITAAGDSSNRSLL